MTQGTTMPRKPRVALMGEFSAGKSTLCNFLLGQNALPEKVTATRVPPVWMTWGDAKPERVTQGGHTETISLEDLEDIPLAETRYIRVQFQVDILKQYDLLDLPGISDPNMSSEVWETMVEEIDSILWCTHATQSWRQSEAGVWATIPDHIKKNSLLLVTKFDKITGERDRLRVLSRLNHEVGDDFDGILPLSLLKAIESETGSDDWKDSGAEEFLSRLLQITDRIDGTAPRKEIDRPEPIVAETAEPAEDAPTDIRNNEPVQLTPNNREAAEISPECQQDSGPRVIPRRVKPNGMPRASRPASDSPQFSATELTSPPGNGDTEPRSRLSDFKGPQ